MKIQGEHNFARPRAVVWRALLDPAILARTLPGCEGLEPVGENQFKGALNVQVGPVKGEFQGTLELSEVVPPEGYRMKLRGQGSAGFMEGEGTIRLEERGAATLLRYDLDAQVGGRIAGVGQRLLESSAKVIARQGLEGLERELQALPAEEASPAGGAPPAGAGAPPPPVRHPTQARMAAQFAGGLFAELVPAAWRVPLLVAAVLAVALVTALLVRACSAG